MPSPGLKVATEEEIERIFEIYKNAPIYPQTGLPSIRHTATRAQVTRRTVENLRDKYGWEERRKAIVTDAQEQVDRRRAKEDAENIEVVGNLFRAALNHLVHQVSEGRLALSATEAIALGRYYAFVRGEPDSRNEDGKSKVVLILPDNGRMPR